MSEVEKLRSTLASASRVHVDASVLALHMAGDRRYTPFTRALLEMLADGEISASTSALSIYQLLVEAYRRGESDTAATAERYLTTVPGLDVIDLTPPIARQASQVRAQLGGSLERAVQIATGLSRGAHVYLTRRSAFRRVAGMSVESMELFAEP
ncbi:MAG: type II toxin-antitoxin system VapC family toxin [Gemmatimonadota bacterium]